jgi:hypothetical protein
MMKCGKLNEEGGKPKAKSMRLKTTWLAFEIATYLLKTL